MTRFNLFPKTRTLYIWTDVRGVAKNTSVTLTEDQYVHVRGRLLKMAEVESARVSILS